jgi:sulfate adenylyltransferase subunit 1 (EFTu-like GTPase family)
MLCWIKSCNCGEADKRKETLAPCRELGMHVHICTYQRVSSKKYRLNKIGYFKIITQYHVNAKLQKFAESPQSSTYVVVMRTTKIILKQGGLSAVVRTIKQRWLNAFSTICRFSKFGNLTFGIV